MIARLKQAFFSQKNTNICELLKLVMLLRSFFIFLLYGSFYMPVGDEPDGRL